MRLNIGGAQHFVVSTEEVANDLLRERGNLYSSREQMPAAVQLLGGGLRPLFLPYNGQYYYYETKSRVKRLIHPPLDVWRRGRKLMHHLTMPRAAQSYEQTQILESTRLIRDLIKSPKEYEFYFERYASSLIFRLGFGRKIESGNEDIVQRILKVVHTLEKVASPGAYLVDIFPWMMHIPKTFAPFKKELIQLHEEEIGLFRELLEDVRHQMKQGKSTKCWEQVFLQKQEQYELTDDEGAYVIGTLFEAGSGTTSAAMMSFMLAMLHHPEWQLKAQSEVDGVVGPARLPTFEDISKLPTVRAIVKETLRWRPVTAGGVPHKLVKDDIYDGYFIPAGTNIHANQWAIHRDDALYPDPETFNPERWLDPSYPTYKEPLTTFPNLQNFSSFGFGRRICPGQNIAERSLNILAARIVWACHISPATDVNGQAIKVPLYDYTSGFNVQPRWFPFSLDPRGPEKVQIIHQAWDDEQGRDPLAEL